MRVLRLIKIFFLSSEERRGNKEKIPFDGGDKGAIDAPV